MPVSPWPTSVRFYTSDGYLYTVENAGEALEALLSIFPEKYGNHYDAAVVACRAVLETGIEDDAARSLFLSALNENKLSLIDKPTGN